jgi:hypothetical protein
MGRLTTSNDRLGIKGFPGYSPPSVWWNEPLAGDVWPLMSGRCPAKDVSGSSVFFNCDKTFKESYLLYVHTVSLRVLCRLDVERLHYSTSWPPSNAPDASL